MNNHKYTNDDKNQRGAALVIAIFSILLVTIIGIGLIGTGLSSQDISKNSREQTGVYYISEAGLTHAIKIVSGINPNQFDTILQAGDGLAYTGDELSTRPSSETPIPSAGLTLGNGRYRVFVSDDAADTDGNPNADSNRRLVITSLGIGQDGSTVTTEAIIESTAGSGRMAILADGLLSSSNEIRVDGSVHSNTAIEISSLLCVSGTISHSSPASMNLSKIKIGLPACTGAPTVGTNVLYNQPKITPDIFDTARLQSEFRPQADYILRWSTNKIFRKGASVPMTAAEITAAGLDSWVWTSSKEWKWGSGVDIPDGIYYSEGANIVITNGGSAVPPAKITLISEGSIEISNGPSFQPKLPGYAIVSANDVKVTCQFGIGGNPGLIYAYGHMEVTNTSTLYGWLHAANFRKPDGTNGLDVNDVGGGNLVQASSKGTIRISNKTTISAPSSGGGSAAMTVLSRREVRY